MESHWHLHRASIPEHFASVCTQSLCHPKAKMGKGNLTGKKRVLAYAKSRTPSDLGVEGNKPKMDFREARRLTVLSGLRAMKAPAVSCQYLGHPGGMVLLASCAIMCVCKLSVTQFAHQPTVCPYLPIHSP